MLQRILRKPAVIEASGKHSSTLYEDISEGTFPPPIKISRQSVGWLENELIAWQRAKIAGKSKADVQALVAELVASRTSMREAA